MTRPLSALEPVLEHKDRTRTPLPELLLAALLAPQGFSILTLPTTFMAVLRLLALGEEVDRALWLHQALVTCHTPHLQAGFLRVKVSLRAKVSLLDQVAQVLGVTLHSPQVLVAPQPLKPAKASGHLRTPHWLKIRRNRLLLDPVRTNQREPLKQSPNLNQ